MLLSSPLLALLAVRAAAQEQPDAPEADQPLAVEGTTTFPDAEMLGLRLINGRPTRAIVDVVNKEDSAITVAYISAALAEPEPESWRIFRNLTASKYNLPIEAGHSRALSYSFVLDMQPQDINLIISVAVSTSDGRVFSVPAHHGTATIVEPPTSFFDPQIIFLYLVLSVAFAGTLYFVYKTWIQALFPQAKRTRLPKKGSRAADPDALLSGSDSLGPSPAATKTYDEMWIPDHHINRPVSRRVKSSAGAKKKLGE